jgi:type IV pilus assembly protein PilC
MKFAYQAQRQSGERVSGREEALDRFALARAMRVRGLVLISATEVVEGKKRAWWQFSWQSTRVPKRDIILFTGNLGILIKAGLPLGRALEVLRRQTKRPALATVIDDLSARISAGSSLAASLEEHDDTFPPVVAAMVRAGEGSGTLPDALALVSSQLKKSYDLRRKVLGALIYPAVVMAAIIVIGILMMIFLIPTLVATFEDLKVELPLTTQIIVAGSNFLTGYWPWLLLVILLLGVGVVALYRLESVKIAWQKLLLKLPVIKKFIEELNAAILMRTISSLLAAGVGLTESLEITAGVLQNQIFRDILKSSSQSIQQGLPLSAAFKSYGEVLPVLTGEMTEVGEETGNLSGMLLKGAEFYEEDIDQLTKNLSTIIEPALMIVVGLVVGVFAVSMIGPLYSISDAF